jgi:hypothetical protein
MGTRAHQLALFVVFESTHTAIRQQRVRRGAKLHLKLVTGGSLSAAYTRDQETHD